MRENLPVILEFHSKMEICKSDVYSYMINSTQRYKKWKLQHFGIKLFVSLENKKYVTSEIQFLGFSV